MEFSVNSLLHFKTFTLAFFSLFWLFSYLIIIYLDISHLFLVDKKYEL